MMPQNYRPGLDVVRLAALLPVLCYHYCIEAARLGFAVPTALIGRGMADWVEVGLAWFFLLSGAALCLQWQGRFDARRYFWARRRDLPGVLAGVWRAVPVRRGPARQQRRYSALACDFFQCWGWMGI